MEKITSVLERIKGKRVYIDANIFVYFLDGSAMYFDTVLPFFQQFNDGLSFAYTGDAAVTEVLYKPYQLDDIVRINEFKAFFANEEFITILPHTTQVFEITAELAPKRKMKMIDALHYATALMAGCPFILTNDDGFTSNAQIEVIQLKDILITEQSI
jgi:predicted nucleic acid-binding protein